jgi:hypothetical protein
MRKEEIIKEYSYVELTKYCSDCKHFTPCTQYGTKGECSKIGIEVKSYGGCRKFDKN